jgi:hypothetical protein
MSAVLGRLAAVFVAPAARAAPVATVARPQAVGVLCSASQAPAAGRAVALGVVRGGVVLVCRWTGEAADDAAMAPGSPALPGPRRLAARLAARGLAVTTRGRIVTVILPADAEPARAACERAIAAAGDVPVVVVVAGPRPAAFDPLLAAQERLVVAVAESTPAALEALAVGQASNLGPPTGVLALRPGPGWARGLRAAVSTALGTDG